MNKEEVFTLQFSVAICEVIQFNLSDLKAGFKL